MEGLLNAVKQCWAQGLSECQQVAGRVSAAVAYNLLSAMSSNQVGTAAYLAKLESPLLEAGNSKTGVTKVTLQSVKAEICLTCNYNKEGSRGVKVPSLSLVPVGIVACCWHLLQDMSHLSRDCTPPSCNPLMDSVCHTYATVALQAQALRLRAFGTGTMVPHFDVACST